jgi:uncharacterized protein YndB with AHSA1/START domain
MSETTFRPSPIATVECRADGDRWTLVFVRVLRHAPERVWAALTRPDELAAWAPFTADRDLAGAGGATLTMIDGDVSEDLPATVTRVERPRLLEYTWGADLLLWELEPVDRGTRLTLRHTLEDRVFVPRVAAGRHLCLDVAERLLDGRPIDQIRGRDARRHGWDRLHAAYGARLGIDVAGPPDEPERSG